jgi:predicted secreted hydrolase
MVRMLLTMLLALAGSILTSHAHAAPAVFAPVTPGRALSFPLDYGAHPDFHTEWWYVTGWLNTPDGKPLGFQVTFFRSRTANDTDNPSSFAAKQLIIGHAAISDPAVGHLVHDQRIVREGFGIAWARTGTTDVKLDDWSMRRDADGRYRVTVKSGALSYDLVLTPTQPPLPEGDAGFSQKGPKPEQASYYYSEPQLQVQGTVRRPAEGKTPASDLKVTGSAWLDHEWSSQYLADDAAGWDWVGANLDDGSALMAFQIRAKNGGKVWAHAVVRTRAGRVTQYAPADVTFAPQTRWTSPRTGATYPVGTVLTTGRTRWTLTPLQPDQELDSRRSTGSVYWEGAVRLERDGTPAGRGYLELTGYVQALRF